MRKVVLLVLALAMGLQGVYAQSDNVSVGPWVTAVTENSASILWTSDKTDMGWVEFEDGTRVYDTFAGRRIFDSFHRVDLKNLAVDGILKYRVGGRYLLDESNPYDPKFGDEWNGEWYSVRMFNDTDKDITFSVTNDIHMDTVAYRKLISCVDMDKADFIFLNGDIVSAGNYDIPRLVEYQIAPLGEYAHNIPVFFSRGNHEGRGNAVKNVAAIYPNNVSGTFYYGFREGPAAFVVMDGGETHTDRSMDYSGTPVFEEYLNEQIAWLKKAVTEEWLTSAPLKICFVHAPMIDDPNKNRSHLHRWMNTNIVPILNEAGFDLMIGADLHQQLELLPGTMHNDFPIIVNSAAQRLDFDARDGKMSIKCFDKDGKEVYSGIFEY